MRRKCQGVFRVGGCSERLSLPCRWSRRPPAVERIAPRGPGTPPEGPQTRILVVDDDPQTPRHVREALPPAGYAPTTTGDPEEVPGLIQTQQPQLVLLDLLLPGIHGIELMERVPDLGDGAEDLLALLPQLALRADVPVGPSRDRVDPRANRPPFLLLNEESPPSGVASPSGTEARRFPPPQSLGRLSASTSARWRGVRCAIRRCS